MSVEGERDASLPQLDEVLGQIQEGKAESDYIEKNYQTSFTSDSARIEADWTHLKGLEDHYWHKGKWSFFLMGLLVAMIGFQSVLLWKVGAGIWNFENYKWLLPALLVQNLGQVIALAVIVVKSLFR